MTLRDVNESTGSGNPVVGARLRRARLSAGLTQRDVLEAFGRDPLNNSWISNKETGKRGVNADELAEFARLYNTTTDALLGVSPPNPIGIREQMAVWVTELPDRIPIYEQGAHASITASPVMDFVWVEPNDSRHLAGVKVEGRCLEPEIVEGDVVIIDTSIEARSGDVVVASVDDGLVVGRVRINGNSWYLRNGDGEWEIEPQQIEGVKVEVRRRGRG